MIEKLYPRPSAECDDFLTLKVMGKKVLMEKRRNRRVYMIWANGVLHESLSWDEQAKEFVYMVDCEKGDPYFCEREFRDACTRAVLALSEPDWQEFFGQPESTEAV